MNIKYVPRTGIDQPFMIQAPKFIETHKEFERVAVVNVSPLNSKTFMIQPALIQKLENEESENGTQNNLNSKIVYDCLDPSPFYETTKEPYMNENDFVDLGPSEENGPS